MFIFKERNPPPQPIPIPIPLPPLHPTRNGICSKMLANHLSTSVLLILRVNIHEVPNVFCYISHLPSGVAIFSQISEFYLLSLSII